MWRCSNWHGTNSFHGQQPSSGCIDSHAAHTCSGAPCIISEGRLREAGVVEPRSRDVVQPSRVHNIPCICTPPYPPLLHVPPPSARPRVLTPRLHPPPLLHLRLRIHCAGLWIPPRRVMRQPRPFLPPLRLLHPCACSRAADRCPNCKSPGATVPCPGCTNPILHNTHYCSHKTQNASCTRLTPPKTLHGAARARGRYRDALTQIYPSPPLPRTSLHSPSTCILATPYPAVARHLPAPFVVQQHGGVGTARTSRAKVPGKRGRTTRTTATTTASKRSGHCTKRICTPLSLFPKA